MSTARELIEQERIARWPDSFAGWMCAAVNVIKSLQATIEQLKAHGERETLNAINAEREVERLKAENLRLQIGWDQRISERWHINPEQRDRRDRLDRMVAAYLEFGNSRMSCEFPSMVAQCARILDAIDAHLLREEPK